MERRTALTGGLAAVAALGTVATGAGRAVAASPASGATDAARRHPPAPTPAEFDALVRTHPAAAPAVEFAFAAVVDVAEAESMGVGPLGERRIVPILGGRFAGPRLAGTVVPGGADRQLVRDDGARLLYAQYELRTDDGA